MSATSLLSKVRRWFGSRSRPWEDPSNPIWIESDDAGGGQGGRVSALSLPNVYRAMRLISYDTAKLPVNIWRRQGDERILAEQDPAYKVLNRQTNPYVSSINFISTIINHAMLHGNGYAFIERDWNSVKAMYLINPKRIYPVVEVSGVEQPAAEGRFIEPEQELFYVWTMEDGNQRWYPANDIFHVRNMSGNSLEGYPVLQLALHSFGLDSASRDYGLAFFKNNARPNVVLKHPARLSDQARERLKASWNSKYRGLGNAHATAILEEGMGLDTVTINAQDAQMLETRQFQVREVANFFSLPSHLLGDDSKVSYNSLEQENASYLAQSLDPWLVTFEREVNSKLLNDRKASTHYCEFDRSALIRADLSTRYESYSKALMSGWMSRDEVRRRENLNPIPEGEGELFYIPSGVTIAGEEPASSDQPVGDEEDQAPDEESGTEIDDADGRQEAAREYLQVAGQRMIFADVATRLLMNIRRARGQSGPIVGLERKYRDKIDRAIRPVIVSAAIVENVDPAERLTMARGLFLDRLRSYLTTGGDADAFGLALAEEVFPQ